MPLEAAGLVLTATGIGAPLGIPLMWLGARPYYKHEQKHLQYMRDLRDEHLGGPPISRAGRIDQDALADIIEFRNQSNNEEDYLS